MRFSIPILALLILAIPSTRCVAEDAAEQTLAELAELDAPTGQVIMYRERLDELEDKLEELEDQYGEDDIRTETHSQAVDEYRAQYEGLLSNLPERMQDELHRLWGNRDEEEHGEQDYEQGLDHEGEDEDDEHEDHGLQEFLGDLEIRLDELEVAVSELFEMAEEALDDAGEHVDEWAEDAEIVLYRIRYAKAERVTETINEVLEGSPFRIAVEDDSNSIVFRAPKKVIEVVDRLVESMDSVAKEHQESTSAGSVDSASTSSQNLQIRVYWLADNQSEEAVSAAANYLPGAVIEAVGGMGLQHPGIVSQSVATAMLEEEDGTGWETESAATISDQVFRISCGGELVYSGTDQMPLVFRLRVSQGAPGSRGPRGSSDVCELNGSTQATLGHYLILGTANHVTATAPPRPAGGRGGFGGGYGGGYGGEVVEQPAAPKLANTRFAFVVQVTEARSFAAE
ncbi:MAG: secretin N-terminal domain-containing protein [Planctomycetota bacterium]